MKFDMHVKNIFKIFNYVNFFSGNCSHWLQTSFWLNFVLKYVASHLFLV